MSIDDVFEYANKHEIDIMYLNNPSYENSIIGISYDDRIIYDMKLMIKEIMEKDNITETEAIEFIEYNTLKALSYYENAPIILYTRGNEGEI